MFSKICQNKTCLKIFNSKHSRAKFCSKSCANRANASRFRVANTRYSDEDLLDALREKAEKLGRTPSKKDMTKPDAWTIRNRFGSWNKAVSASGLIPNNQLPASFFEGDEHRVSLSLRFKILRRDGFKCSYCGGTPKEGYVLHVDHVVPVSEGGLTEEQNLVAACWACNIGKSNKPAGRS